MKFANHYGYSDITPYEVIKENTPKKLTIRSMNSDLDPNWKPEHFVGGFRSNVANNQTQKWIITSRENGVIFAIRLHKDGTWKDSVGNKYRVENTPKRFYDYNF